MAFAVLRSVAHLVSTLLVWIVSNEQLLAWMKNLVPASQLNQLDAFKCTSPQVSAKICNGIPANENGLLSHCDFPDFPFFTCVCTPYFSQG